MWPYHWNLLIAYSMLYPFHIGLYYYQAELSLVNVSKNTVKTFDHNSNSWEQTNKFTPPPQKKKSVCVCGGGGGGDFWLIVRQDSVCSMILTCRSALATYVIKTAAKLPNALVVLNTSEIEISNERLLEVCFNLNFEVLSNSKFQELLGKK